MTYEIIQTKFGSGRGLILQVTNQRLIEATRTLSEGVGALSFAAPAAFVYNPLEYAWAAHRQYLERFAGGKKRVLFLGMNPGPFGMAQTGVPFGEIKAVRDWMGIEAPIGKPAQEHPGKPVEGFACPRSEVSGRRLWGLFAKRCGTPEKFFAEHYVHNYCPLLFLEGGKSGKNLTPEVLPRAASAQLFALCDDFLRLLVATQQIEWAIGVGGFAEQRLRTALPDTKIKIGKIIHPSPASPAANRGWEGIVSAELERLGVW